MKDSNSVSMIPNVVMWSWMRTVLDLTGMELLLFAYVFSQTFDSVHECYSCLTDMGEWFGATRQTVSRNIDSLVSKNFILKNCRKDIINPIIKHNSYYVNTEYITQLCENSDYDSYSNFLDSYRTILKQKFPNDTSTIDEYLWELSSWHKNKDISVCVSLNELATILSSDQTENDDLPNLISSLKKHNNKIKSNPIRTYIEKPVDTQDKTQDNTNKLFREPKKKSKKALKAEWDVDKRAMTNSFIFMNLGGNEELLELLLMWLDTDNGKSYTPLQWEQQLETLYKYGRTPERMIEGVRMTYMNNYRQLYLIDKSEVDIDLKLSEIEKYVAEFGENSEELKELLRSYVMEVPKARSYTVKQFRLSLKQLTQICTTLEEKIASVQRSYVNSYSALAYQNQSIHTNQVLDVPVDMEKKEQKIRDFIKTGYYHLCDGLESSLMDYIHKTKVGQTMSYDGFCVILDNLRVYCLDDADKVNKVRLAIQNNSNKFATEDFEETKKIKAKLETRESKAKSLDRARMQKVIMEKMKNPNNPKLKDVEYKKKSS